MPKTFLLNHPIPQTRKINGERIEATLDRFTCRELTPGEKPPADDMVAAVIKCTRTEAGEVPSAADLCKLDLEGGISAAVQAIFNL